METEYVFKLHKNSHAHIEKKKKMKKMRSGI